LNTDKISKAAVLRESHRMMKSSWLQAEMLNRDIVALARRSG
jgi:hypothetical protein